MAIVVGAIVDVEVVVTCFCIEAGKVEGKGGGICWGNVPGLAFLVAVVAIGSACVGKVAAASGEAGAGRCPIEGFVKAVPIPMNAWIYMGLVGKVLVTFDFVTIGTQRLQAGTGRAIIGFAEVDSIAGIGDVLDQIYGGGVKGIGIPGSICYIAFVFDANGGWVGASYMPGFGRFEDHLGDLPVCGTHDIMGGYAGGTVLEPGNSPGIGSLDGVYGHG